MSTPNEPATPTAETVTNDGLVYPVYTASELRRLPKDGPRLTLAQRDALDAALIALVTEWVAGVIAKGGGSAAEH